MDLFAHKLSELNQTDRFRPPDNSGPVIGDPFETSTTTAKPPWTLRTETTEIPKYDLDVVDSDILSKQYSKIARITVARHEAIERACGHHYLIKYLFMHELMQTREIWQDFIWTAIIGELIFLLTAVLTLMCVCCFIEHRGAKLLVMILWWLEWIPIFLHYDALIRSQSKRLCILENASAYIKGQLFFLIFLVIRAMMFKPYQLLVHFCYIKELLVYGYLKDESINSIEESQYAQKYFQPFYDLEEDRESGNVDAYKNTDTTVSVGFDTIIPAEVANVQNKVMTNQDDPFSIRNQEIIAVQSGKIEQNIKSVRHF
ncbi:uncharacterized protein LOC118436580 [Folsomia candida]|nr:uncharacterized protein LOC118436580 [Folsomia candida]